MHECLRNLSKLQIECEHCRPNSRHQLSEMCHMWGPVTWPNLRVVNIWTRKLLQRLQYAGYSTHKSSFRVTQSQWHADWLMQNLHNLQTWVFWAHQELPITRLGIKNTDKVLRTQFTNYLIHSVRLIWNCMWPIRWQPTPMTLNYLEGTFCCLCNCCTSGSVARINYDMFTHESESEHDLVKTEGLLKVTGSHNTAKW